MQDSRERFTITLLALPADQPEVLRNLKVFLLTEMGLSVDEAQGLLYSLPKEIFKTDSEEQIKLISERLKNFGADFEVQDSQAEVIREVELAIPKNHSLPATPTSAGIPEPQESIALKAEESLAEVTKPAGERICIPAPQLKLQNEQSRDESNYQIHRPAKIISPSVDLKVIQTKSILTNSIIGVSLAAVISLISYYIFIVGDENLFKEVFSSEQVNQIIKTSEDIEVEKTLVTYNHSYTGVKETADIKISIQANFFDKKLERLEFEILPKHSPTTLDPTAIPPLKIEKILGENFTYKTSEDGSFFMTGISKIFLEDLNNKFRIPADSVISGKLNAETGLVSLRLLINRGFKESPNKSVLDVNQRDVNESKFYLDLDLQLRKK